MGLICDQIQELLDALLANEELEGARIMRAYPIQNKPHPLTRPVITLDLEKLQGEPPCLGSIVGSTGTKIFAGHSYAMFLRISVHTPLREGGERCRRMMDSVLHGLLHTKSMVCSYRCGSLTAAKDLGAYVLSAQAEIHGVMRACVQEGMRGIRIKETEARE